MASLKVKIVARSIEIHWQKKDSWELVLIGVRLQLDKKHLLREAVWGVGFLWISTPKVTLAERDRRELRISANCSETDKLPASEPSLCLSPESPHLLDQLN